MRQYFITVRRGRTAIDLDPNAQYIRTLPATILVKGYCCRAAETCSIPPAHIYRVSVKTRKDAELAKGVLRCRAKEPQLYKKSLFVWIC